jgi:hypothetical protein
MTSFNVMAGGRAQVLVDEQQLQQLQAELTRRGFELDRLKAAFETLSAANAPAHFVAAAMALCNELASRWKAERVGIGFLRGRYVRVRALSHTEKITRNMQIVQDIEAAMEECLDQDVEVMFPPEKSASYVYRFTEVLATRHGPNAVISLPLRRERKNVKEHFEERFGNVVGVLTLERKTDKPFNLQEIETLRLTCDLFTARLMDLYENDRWIGDKALRGTKRSLHWLVGAKHTWAKVAAIAVAGFLAFACLKDGMYRVEAPFEVQVIHKQIIMPPYTAQLAAVHANVNEVVFCPATAAVIDDINACSPLAPTMGIPRPKSLLAEMDTLEIEGMLSMARAEALSAHLEEIDALGTQDPRAEGNRIGEALRARAKEDKAKAEISLREFQIRQSKILTPIDGLVLSGDLHTKIGATVQPGEELFQIGQLDIRAEISVPEEEISEVKRNSQGVLKATSYPDRPIKFTVERINPIATPTPSSGKNVFKVRATLDPETSTWLKPGVEGLAKIDVEKHKYAWIWTRRMMNWVRMKLWM